MIARSVSAWAAYACFAWLGCTAAFAADTTIQGVVHNQTSHRFAVGDEVILFRLGQTTGPDQVMREEARTMTDAKGAFTLTARFADGLHLVRVLHQGVNYDRRVTAGDAVSMDVFDAAAKVRGLGSSVEILRLGTEGDRLYISDMIEIVNTSSPPLTEAGKRTFEVILPAGAIIDPVVAAGPDGGLPPGAGAGKTITPTFVRGEPGHYTVDFPLRPGATQFVFKYDLPYNGHATFHPRGMYPVRQFAVMYPPTMTFTSESSSFGAIHTGDGSYKVEASEHLPAGDRPEFEISGAGGAILPPQTPRQAPAQVEAGQRNAFPASRPSGATTGSPRLLPWVLGAGALLLFASCGLLLRRSRRLSGRAPAMQETERQNGPAGRTAAPEIEALKDEFLQLEIGRLRGVISVEEHASSKRSLDLALRRAWAQTGVTEERETPEVSR